MNVDVNTYYIYFRKGDQLAREITDGSGSSVSSVLSISSVSSGSGETGGSGSFYHHGIYVGEEEVIEYTDDSNIHRVSLTEFKHGQSRVFLVVYTENTVKIAEEACKVPTCFGQYNCVKNNCEHFATYCKYGQQCSQQVHETFDTIYKDAIKALGLLTGRDVDFLL